MEPSEEQENVDETFKDSSCRLQVETELRSALKHIMRQDSLLTTNHIFKEVTLCKRIYFHFEQCTSSEECCVVTEGNSCHVKLYAGL